MSEVELRQLSKSYGATSTVGPVSLTVKRGELLSLLGPSGCGKTTVLRMIAGFVTPTTGSIHLRDADVTRVPPYRRQAALVFQSFALFPHLSVSDNIAFGLRRRRVPKPEITARVKRLITMMRLDGLADRLPKALSGGQQQRVALARALAIEPAVILLDEPFSSLDTKLRESTRMELRGLQQELGFTAILVTHDQAEALSISDRIAVMNAGHLEQVDMPQVIYNQPASLFVAEFIGTANRVDGGIVRPEAVHIVSSDSPGAVSVTVESCAFQGGSSQLVVRTGDGTPLSITTDGLAPTRYPPGSTTWITWSPEAVIRFGEKA